MYKIYLQPRYVFVNSFSMFTFIKCVCIRIALMLI